MNTPPSTPILIPILDRPALRLRSNAYSSPPGSYVMSSAAGNPIRLIGAKSRSPDSSMTTTPEETMNELIIHPENDANCGYTPRTPTRRNLKAPFYSALERQQNGLSVHDFDDLGSHYVSRELASKMFVRSRIDSAKAPLLGNFERRSHRPFREPEEDELSEMGESYNSIALNPTFVRTTDDDQPKTVKAALVKKFLAKSHTLASLVNPVKPVPLQETGEPISEGECPSGNQSTLVPTRKPHVRFEQAPPPGQYEAERMIPEVVIDEDIAQTMSQADIDALLDSMLPAHAAEFMADQERLHKGDYSGVTHGKDQVLEHPSRGYVGCTHERPKPMSLRERGIRMFKGESPAPEATDDYCRKCEQELAQKRANELQQEVEHRRLEIDELWGIVAPRPPSRHRQRSESFSRAEIESISETIITEDLYPPLLRIEGGISLCAIAGHPSQFDGPSSDAVSVSSFGCIFIVWIPVSSIEAAVSQHGRPLIHENAEFHKYTVVASYHHNAREVVMDMVDFTLCPLGFSTDQLVDLIYLQKGGYLPPYVVWPAPVLSPGDFVLTHQWSLCRPVLNGQDVLHASDIDVMVQRIAGAMYRLGATSTMAFHNRRRFLEGLIYNCEVEINVTLKVSTRNWHQDRYAAKVPVSFEANVHFDWHLPTPEQLTFGHSRNSHPLGPDMLSNPT